MPGGGGVGRWKPKVCVNPPSRCGWGLLWVPSEALAPLDSRQGWRGGRLCPGRLGGLQLWGVEFWSTKMARSAMGRAPQ